MKDTYYTYYTESKRKTKDQRPKTKESQVRGQWLLRTRFKESGPV